MERHDDKVHLNQEEASGGSKEGVVRWVLVAGLLLAVVLLSIIWMTGALTQDEAESAGTAPDRIEAQTTDGTGTDSIILETDNDAAAEPAAANDVPLETIEN